MRISAILPTALLVLLCGFQTSAQAPPAGTEPDPGVKPTRLLDRPEVRVTRVEIQPGRLVRSVHTPTTMSGTTCGFPCLENWKSLSAPRSRCQQFPARRSS